jgi:DNA-binding response OmpR family regulator
VIGKTALLIDDEEELLDAFAFAVRHAGFCVRVARNGADAFELMRQEPPDVVITDVRMPGGSGTDLFTRVQAAFPSPPPFVIATGFADLTLERAYAVGIEAVLLKPFELTELQATVRRVTTPAAERWMACPAGDDGCAVELAPGAHQVSLGRGGAFVATSRPPRAGERVRLRLPLGDDNLCGSGIVRWSRSDWLPGCGIEFVSLADPSAQAARLAGLRLQAFIPSQ